MLSNPAPARLQEPTLAPAALPEWRAPSSPATEDVAYGGLTGVPSGHERDRERHPMELIGCPVCNVLLDGQDAKAALSTHMLLAG